MRIIVVDPMSPYRANALRVRVIYVANAREIVLQTLACAGINVLAHTTYGCRSACVILVLTNNAKGAKAVLEEAGFPCRFESVLVIPDPDQKGLAARYGALIVQQGIALLYSYTSHTTEPATITVLKTTDDDRALLLLDLFESLEAAA